MYTKYYSARRRGLIVAITIASTTAIAVQSAASAAPIQRNGSQTAVSVVPISKGAAPEIAAVSPGANTSTYEVEMVVDLSSSESAGSKMTVRGNAEVQQTGARRVVRFEPTTVTRVDADGTETAAMDKETAETLRLPFGIGGRGDDSVWFDPADTDSSRNLKRQIAEQLMRSSEATIIDAFGKVQTSDIDRVDNGSSYTVTERRTNASYSELSIAPELQPQIEVVAATTFDEGTGQVIQSQDIENVKVSIGDQPGTTGQENSQSATSKTTLTLVRTSVSTVQKVNFDAMELTSTAPVISDQEVADGKRAATRSVEETLADLQDGEASPADVNSLIASLDARPEEAGIIAKRIEAGSLHGNEVTGVAAALAATNSPLAGPSISQMLVDDRIAADTRTDLVTMTRVARMSSPEILGAIESLAKSNDHSLAGVARSVIQIEELPEPCVDCPPPPPGGGGTAPAPITLPYNRIWTHTIGNSYLGGEVGAKLDLSGPTLPDGHTGFNASAEAWAKAFILGFSPTLARGSVSSTVDTSSPQYRRNFAAQLRILGVQVVNYADSVPCNWTYERNLYQGHIGLGSFNFQIGVGWFTFIGGGAASAHLSVPMRAHLEGCGLPLDAVAEASITPHAWAQGTVYGGVRILGPVFSAGLEVSGTALNTSIKPAAELRYTAINVPSPKITGHVSVTMTFQALTIRVRAWIKFLWWKKWWTLVNWASTPYNWTLYDRTFQIGGN